MDDDTGWHDVLVGSWSPRVRAAVCRRVVERFAARRGVLAATVLAPDDAPARWVEDVHVAVARAIAAETGADIEELGSQTAWAIYDDVWGALGRDVEDDALVPVPPSRVGQAASLVAELPADAALHAGAVPDAGGRAELLVLAGRPRVHVDGLLRWLATDEAAPDSHRALARALVAVVRDDPLGA